MTKKCVRRSLCSFSSLNETNGTDLSFVRSFLSTSKNGAMDEERHKYSYSIFSKHV
jgi:hypothetical protein